MCIGCNLSHKLGFDSVNTVRLPPQDTCHLLFPRLRVFPGVTLDLGVCRTSGHPCLPSCICELCSALFEFLTLMVIKVHPFIHLWSRLFLLVTQKSECRRENGSCLLPLHPSLGGEHLCITLSISTGLAPILVECELAFGKSQRGHLVTLSGTQELHWAQMRAQTERIPGPSGILIGFHLEDFLGSFSSSMPPSMLRET